VPEIRTPWDSTEIEGGFGERRSDVFVASATRSDYLAITKSELKEKHPFSG
jgi:hypothetical protein